MAESQKSKSNIPIIVAIVAIIAIIIGVVVAVSVSEHSTTTGEYPKPVQATALKCTSTSYVYPYAKDLTGTSQSYTMNAVFEGDDLSSITNIYSVRYADTNALTDAKNTLHTAMNLAFSRDDLAADALSANYSVNKDTLQLSLYAIPTELKASGARYFLLDNVSPPYRLSDVKSTYTKLGFKCTESK